MKNRRWIYYGLAALLAIFIAATALYAAPGRSYRGNDKGYGAGMRNGTGFGFGGGRHMGNRRGGGLGGGMLSGMLRELNLTDEQKDEVKAVFEKHKDTLTDMRTNLRDARWDFRAATLAENPNPDDIRAAAQKTAGFQADMAIEMVGIKAEIRGLLTDEQRNVLDEHKGRILERMRGFQEGLGRCLDSIEE